MSKLGLIVFILNFSNQAVNSQRYGSNCSGEYEIQTKEVTAKRTKDK